MFFKDVIGQEEAKQRLIAEVKEGRIPHAQLICGPEGTGKLPLAIAYAVTFVVKTVESMMLAAYAPVAPSSTNWHIPIFISFSLSSRKKPEKIQYAMTSYRSGGNL